MTDLTQTSQCVRREQPPKLGSNIEMYQMSTWRKFEDKTFVGNTKGWNNYTMSALEINGKNKMDNYSISKWEIVEKEAKKLENEAREWNSYLSKIG